MACLLCGDTDYYKGQFPNVSWHCPKCTEKIIDKNCVAKEIVKLYLIIILFLIAWFLFLDITIDKEM